MLLGDANIEGAVGEALHHIGHRAACRHGRRHTHDAFIPLGQLDERVAEDVLELWRLGLCRAGLEALARRRVKLPWGVPYRRLLLGRRIALALGRRQMQQAGALHILDVPQDLHQLHDIMPIDGPEVADVEAVEEVGLPREERLEAVIEAQQPLPLVLLHQVQLA